MQRRGLVRIEDRFIRRPRAPRRNIRSQFQGTCFKANHGVPEIIHSKVIEEAIVRGITVADVLNEIYLDWETVTAGDIERENAMAGINQQSHYRYLATFVSLEHFLEFKQGERQLGVKMRFLVNLLVRKRNSML